MSHVLSFEIRGLNGRKKPVAYELDRHTNVFFGPNGSGKTSILKIIDSAMNDSVEQLESVNFTSATVLMHTLTHKKNLSLSYTKPVSEGKDTPGLEAGPSDDLYRLATELNSKVEQPKSWKIEPPIDTDRQRRWAHIYLPTSRLYIGGRQIIDTYRRMVRASPNATDLEDDLDSNFADSLQRLWGRKFSSILAKVRVIQQDALQSIFLDALAPEAESRKRPTGRIRESGALDANRAFDRMSSFLQRQSNKRIEQSLGSKESFSARYAREARLRNLVKQIDTVEARIEAEMKPIEELSHLVKRLFLSGKTLSFDGPLITVKSDDHKLIGIERLSSGEKHLIRILVAAIDAEESTLLIDEPELSLHIDWQRELINNIHSLNPECQLIFATHSPEIMADIPDRTIFRI